MHCTAPLKIDAMIHFSLNDQVIETETGITVLQAARGHGITIPTLCFHPALKPSGACKLCAVEVTGAAGRRVIMLSCLLKAKEGMRVHTDSPQVLKARTAAIERLHALAPMSPRVREIASAHGIALPLVPDGCIRCRMCIRVCREIVGQAALRTEKIDGREQVVPVPGRCIGCGTCANLCPTQAIRIMDQGGVRIIRIREEIIGQHPLERCQGCGKYYATERQVQFVEHRTAPHAHVKVPHHYCPICAKLFSDRLQVMGKQPPRNRFNRGHGES
jgi:bidirectional [NiFe] hydrogenase diaphorase subunit